MDFDIRNNSPSGRNNLLTRSPTEISRAFNRGLLYAWYWFLIFRRQRYILHQHRTTTNKLGVRRKNWAITLLRILMYNASPWTRRYNKPPHSSGVKAIDTLPNSFLLARSFSVNIIKRFYQELSTGILGSYKLLSEDQQKSIRLRKINRRFNSEPQSTNVILAHSLVAHGLLEN